MFLIHLLFLPLDWLAHKARMDQKRAELRAEIAKLAQGNEALSAQIKKLRNEPR